MLRFIAVALPVADIVTSALGSGNDDITTFLGLLKVHRCWKVSKYDT
jgi:hypothetical protein